MLDSFHFFFKGKKYFFRFWFIVNFPVVVFEIPIVMVFNEEN
ncbi:hypothetical protein SAMD00023520_00074 [Listeria monocytogenes]|nr:hypothetical protein SAMD00023518_00443 [Listeria monocytogenes]GAT37914.1 hypothetical protein SAMD00023519_00071 [Listeria monocytogenes]GAT40144.1 hypothetical protein SAMD00023520_00074 [Listeria monocytogenes]